LRLDAVSPRLVVTGPIYPGLLRGDQALNELGTYLLLGSHALSQRYFADWDSAGRRCATGLHKLGVRYAVPLKTNAADNGRIG